MFSQQTWEEEKSKHINYKEQQQSIPFKALNMRLFLVICEAKTMLNELHLATYRHGWIFFNPQNQPTIPQQHRDQFNTRNDENAVWDNIHLFSGPSSLFSCKPSSWITTLQSYVWLQEYSGLWHKKKGQKKGSGKFTRQGREDEEQAADLFSILSTEGSSYVVRSENPSSIPDVTL